MQRASVTRIFREWSSEHAVMMLEANNSKEEYRVHIPVANANIIALEGHGLNDRCGTYSIFADCVSALGGAFGSVVITFNGGNAVGASMAIARDNHILSWINGSIVDLVAFALHVRLPIYVHDIAANNANHAANHSRSQSRNTPVPGVFEDALSDILRNQHGMAMDSDDASHSGHAR
ncbi:MAG: DUF151 domain-containing protein [Chloroflexi bacterium]|nr:DUF151 domain-containing protein [Chloroflexota bacterium]